MKKGTEKYKILYTDDISLVSFTLNIIFPWKSTTKKAIFRIYKRIAII